MSNTPLEQTKSKTIGHYLAVLPTLDISIDPKTAQLIWNGDPSGDPLPLTIDKKPLVLPYPMYLNSAEKMDTITAWHPLSESSSATISKVHARMVKLIEVQLNTHYARLMITFVKASRDTKVSAMVKKGVRTGLSMLDELNEANHDYIIRQLENMDPAGRVSLIRLKSVKNAEIDGKQYLRGVRVYSPLYDQLRKEECDKFVTAKFPNKKTKSALLTIFSLFFGKDRDKLIPQHDLHNYSSGVHSHVVPTYTSFLMSYAAIREDLNYLCQKEFKKLLEAYGETQLLKPHPIDWIDALGEIKTFVHEIPPLEGNYSDVDSKFRMKLEAEEDNKAVSDHEEEYVRRTIPRTLSDPHVATPVPQGPTVNQPVQQPVQTSAPVSKPNVNEMSFEDFQRRRHAPQQSAYQPPQFQQPVQQFSAPQPQYQPPQYQAPQPQFSAPPVMHNGGWGQPQPPQQPMNWGEKMMYEQQHTGNPAYGQPPVPSIQERSSRRMSLNEIGRTSNTPANAWDVNSGSTSRWGF